MINILGNAVKFTPSGGTVTFVAKPLFAGKVLDEFREAFIRKNAKLARETADLRYRRVLLAEDVQQSMQAGLNAHLSKPVERMYCLKL